MEKAAYLLSRFRQSIVKHDRCLGLLEVKWHIATLEQVDRLNSRLQDQVHSAAEDYNSAAVGQKLFHIGGLDSGNVMRVGLLPIPLASAAGIELEVAPNAEAIGLDATPGNVSDSR